MAHAIQVENIKCGGCANGISQKLMAIDGVKSVDVDVEAGVVDYQLDTENDAEAVREQVKQALYSLGYPEVGTIEGLESVGSKAKSYVSCAIGKMTNCSSE